MDNFGGYSGNYSNTEWTAALDLFFSMRFDQADHEFMGGLPYEVVEIIDNATNRNYYVLREIPDFHFMIITILPVILKMMNMEHSHMVGEWLCLIPIQNMELLFHPGNLLMILSLSQLPLRYLKRPMQGIFC
jgi:hypothetical protein